MKGEREEEIDSSGRGCCSERCVWPVLCWYPRYTPSRTKLH